MKLPALIFLPPIILLARPEGALITDPAVLVPLPLGTIPPFIIRPPSSGVSRDLDLRRFFFSFFSFSSFVNSSGIGGGGGDCIII
jgi:hypothetical protein